MGVDELGVDKIGSRRSGNKHLKQYMQHIRITSPCGLYPLTPHFYIVKLGFTGVYIIFLFLL